MEHVYSLCPDRRSGKVNVSLLRRLPVFLLCVGIAFLLIFNLQLYPGISALATAEAKNRTEELMATAFSRAMVEEGRAYSDFVRIGYRTDGVVSSVTCDMQKLNAARNSLLLAVLGGLSPNEGIEVALPLGNLFGGEAFSGRGPAIKVRLLLARGARAYMESEFRSAGINQTLHRILFTVSIQVTVLVPSKPITVTVDSSFCLAETVIVGEVPDAFTQISRLTDDVTEEDIDDMNDFGAHL